ncbi:MAG: LytTR family DNA-binding domain-containing protein, partial [Bacteroidota bacterium]
KYESIHLYFSNLIYIKSADNYVEVYYLENDQLKKKLIRHNLKHIKVDFPQLIQTHRSYLINPAHFIAWDSRHCISLTQSKVPVSDTYREVVLKSLRFVPNKPV